MSNSYYISDYMLCACGLVNAVCTTGRLLETGLTGLICSITDPQIQAQVSNEEMQTLLNGAFVFFINSTGAQWEMPKEALYNELTPTQIAATNVALDSLHYPQWSKCNND